MTTEKKRQIIMDICSQSKCGTCVYKEICEDEITADTPDEQVDRMYHAAELVEISKMNQTVNQTAKADAGKPRLTLVPTRIIYDIAAVREYGNKKYPEGGKDNWKQVEVERYRDAAYRHFLAYLDDPQGVDEESGLSHLAHLATNIAFLCEMEANNGLDR